MRFSTPAGLVEGLHGRVAGARERLWEWMAEPVRRLMRELIARHGLTHDLERLTRHALHLIETWLRTRPVREFQAMSLNAFRATVLLQVARQSVQPFGQGNGQAASASPLPSTPAYEVEAFSYPYEKVGSFWYSGDWYAGMVQPDGSLWVIVADVTGHGYAAYLLASALPLVWQTCWASLAGQPGEPVELLAAMHDRLEPCLPDGVYVECTLARLQPNGQMTVAPAGGSRLLLRRRNDPRPKLLKYRGLWLGLDRPDPQDQQSCLLGEGDEITLATDGLFDQLTGLDGDGSSLPETLAGMTSARLAAALRELLQKALTRGPQKDDVTVVVLSRRPSA